MGFKAKVTAALLNLRGSIQIGAIIAELPLNTILDTTGKAWIEVIAPDGKKGYVSLDFIEYLPDDDPLNQVPVPATPPVTPSGDPPWIVWARSKLGVKEVPGAGDNPEIVGWDKLITSLPASMRHDSTPWCAIFMHASCYYGGIDSQGIDSAAAVDWLKFGKPVTTPKKGDAVIFEWTDSEGNVTGHHVAWVLSVSGGMVHCLGGNQSDAVTLASYSTENVMGYRRAV